MANRSADFKTSTYLYDTYHEITDEVAASPSKVNKIMEEIRRISTKNADTLQGYYVGKPLLVNEADKTAILDVFGLKKEDIVKSFDNSPRLAKDGVTGGINMVADQFAFALPLLLLSGSLHKIGKDDAAKSMMLFAYYCPYASKVAQFWTFGTVDEKAMDYTVNIVLNSKSYIHKYGSVYGALVASAESTYDYYIATLAGRPKPTDDTIYNSIFYSSIFSKMFSMLKLIYGTYIQVKKDNKFLDYKKGFMTSTDDDDEVQTTMVSASSDSSVRASYTNTAVSGFISQPVDSTSLSFATQIGFGLHSELYESYLKDAIMNVSEQKAEKIPKYFDSMIGAFLNSIDDSGVKNTPKDIKTAKFLAYVKRKVSKSQHTTDTDVLSLQALTTEFLEDCSLKYANFGTTQKTHMKEAFVIYFALFIQTSNK
jgi:hypothetical protein